MMMTSTMKDHLNNESLSFLTESGVLPVLPRYDIQSEIVIPASFPSLEAVRAFINIADLRGYSYRVRNTSSDHSRISYSCSRCRSSLTFSLKGDSFRPTARNARLCDCPRIGRSGNKLQRFPPEMANVAVAALLMSGLTDVSDAGSEAINAVLEQDWGFIVGQDNALAIRVREEYRKVDPLRNPDYNGSITRFSKVLGDTAPVVCNIAEDGKFLWSFVALCNCEEMLPSREFAVMRHYSARQHVTHYVAFVAGSLTPVAWGSVALGRDLDNDAWFSECLGKGCRVYLNPAYSQLVQDLFSAEYSAFGLSYAMYSLGTANPISLRELLLDDSAVAAKSVGTSSNVPSPSAPANDEPQPGSSASSPSQQQQQQQQQQQVAAVVVDSRNRSSSNAQSPAVAATAAPQGAVVEELCAFQAPQQQCCHPLQQQQQVLYIVPGQDQQQQQQLMGWYQLPAYVDGSIQLMGSNGVATTIVNSAAAAAPLELPQMVWYYTF